MAAEALVSRLGRSRAGPEPQPPPPMGRTCVLRDLPGRGRGRRARVFIVGPKSANRRPRAVGRSAGSKTLRTLRRSGAHARQRRLWSGAALSHVALVHGRRLGTRKDVWGLRPSDRRRGRQGTVGSAEKGPGGAARRVQTPETGALAGYGRSTRAGGRATTTSARATPCCSSKWRNSSEWRRRRHGLERAPSGARAVASVMDIWADPEGRAGVGRGSCPPSASVGRDRGSKNV